MGSASSVRLFNLPRNDSSNEAALSERSFLPSYDGVRRLLDISTMVMWQVGEPDNWLFGEIRGVCDVSKGVSVEKTRRKEYVISTENEPHIIESVDAKFVFALGPEPNRLGVGPKTRRVAVQVETHGTMRFLAILLQCRPNKSFEVQFLSDGTILAGVSEKQLFKPDKETKESSPTKELPEPKWLQDRKILMDIDLNWPLSKRIEEAFKQMRHPRPANMPPLRGPFSGKANFDSEGLKSHPAPLPELTVNGIFVETWSKYCGKIKFATTYKIGPDFPGNHDWVDQVDAGDALYFVAALPVFAGLICLGDYEGQPEWIRLCDVALVGIALYVDGDLSQGFDRPPLMSDGKEQFGHDSCHFIPGCVSTYLANPSWVGGVFCLAPVDSDFEVMDDIYNIQAYQAILNDCESQMRDGIRTKPEVTLTVNLVLSTSYLANLRQVCAGAVTVQLSSRGLSRSTMRTADVQTQKLFSEYALNPKRARKVLVERPMVCMNTVNALREPLRQEPLSPLLRRANTSLDTSLNSSFLALQLPPLPPLTPGLPQPNTQSFSREERTPNTRPFLLDQTASSFVASQSLITPPHTPPRTPTLTHTSTNTRPTPPPPTEERSAIGLFGSPRQATPTSSQMATLRR